LLLGQEGSRLPGLRVRDRGGDELGELLEPALGVGLELVTRIDGDRTPETAVDDDRTGDLRQVAVGAEELGGPEAAASTSCAVMRAERPVRSTWVGANSSSGGNRDPSGTASTLLETPTTRCSGPGSKRTTPATSDVTGFRWKKTRSTSTLTAAKMFAGAAPCATSVATRWMAACSSTSRSSASRDANHLLGRHRSAMLSRASGRGRTTTAPDGSDILASSSGSEGQ
jgi:hypothetical protein